MWFWKMKQSGKTPKEPEFLKETKEKQQVWVLEIDKEANLPAQKGLVWNQYLEGDSSTIVQSRRPKERFTEYQVGTDFLAAGKAYSTEEMLRACGQERVWDYDSSGYHDMVGKFTDIYDRKVYYLSERFPCYDHYDKKYENRFYRYYFLCEDNKLICIRFADGSSYLSVTEDTASIEYRHWRKLREQGWIFGERDR